MHIGLRWLRSKAKSKLTSTAKIKAETSHERWGGRAARVSIYPDSGSIAKGTYLDVYLQEATVLQVNYADLAISSSVLSSIIVPLPSDPPHARGKR